MKILIRPLLWSLFVAACFCTNEFFRNNRICTTSGEVRGKTVFFQGKPVRAYLGIPYVNPPIGELRFKKPVPINQIRTKLEAKELGPRCVQYLINTHNWTDISPGMSEDCLRLNIWVPPTASTFNKKTVMFFIHTGGFTTRSSGLDFYQGQALAAEGDVIVVSINYRLSALGFFYSATEDAPGNVGMLDMVEALKWVRTNIESFGGNKHSVTLFSNSAGSIAVGMLTISPLSRGLFRRAVLQSGSPTNLDAEDNNKTYEDSKKLAEAVGCADDVRTLENDPKAVVECMRDVDASELANMLYKVTAGSLRSAYPRYGDEFLQKNPRQSIIDGDFQPVDLLIGTTDGDGSPILTSKNRDVFGLYGEKNPKINRSFGEFLIRNYFKNYPDPEDVVKQYLENVDEEDYDEIRFQVFTAIGDYQRICTAVYFAESFAAKKANVYHYFFTRRPANSPWAPWMLAVHHDDVPFVFGYPLRYPQDYTLSEQALSRRMIQIWSSFAKTGRPGLENWSRYSKESPLYQVLDTNNTSIGYGPHRANCDVFRSTFGF